MKIPHVSLYYSIQTGGESFIIIFIHDDFVSLMLKNIKNKVFIDNSLKIILNSFLKGK